MADPPKVNLTPGQVAAPKPLTPEQVAALKPMDVPTFFATAFHIQGSGTHFSIVLQRGVPAVNPDGSLNQQVGKLENVALINVSPHALKDLSLLLVDQVKKQEAQFGILHTPYTKKLEAKAKDGK